jgi:4-diphosphocytidyl-2-C-methyl-D-erythritol kinase
MSRLTSFAKINLGLEITGKRPDGYHTLKTIFQTVDLFDTITIEENSSGKIRLSGNNPAVEWGRTNTIYRVIDTLYSRYNLNRGFDITVDKRIPHGSGLGGGSSNAAVVLLFLNQYFHLDLSMETLIEIAASVGADVPFFLFGGTVLAEGIGEKMIPLEFTGNKQNLRVDIVVPSVNISTRLIFSRFILTSCPIKSKIDSFINSQNFRFLENNLENVTFNLFPEVGRIKEEMKTFAYDLVLMSGSGSAVYGISTLSGTRYKADTPLIPDIHALKHRFPDAEIKITQTIDRQTYFNRIGASPSGKASVFGADTRRFESSRPRNL